METVLELLRNTLAQLELEWQLMPSDVLKALEAIDTEAKRGSELPDELVFERIAFELALYEEPYVWGTRYGPWISKESDLGRIDRPDRASITEACIDYWSNRMNATQHPSLRGRYGDLVWDLSSVVTDHRPPIAAAYAAIDGYVEAITSGRSDDFNGSGDVQWRAISLAASLDSSRLETALNRLRAFADSSNELEERDRRQLQLFLHMLRVTGARRPLSHLNSLAVVLRRRIDELHVANADRFTIGDIALPLASFYRGEQLSEDAKAVLQIWGSSTERMASEPISAIVASEWLREVHEIYQRHDMHTEARAVIGKIEEVSSGIQNELVRVSGSATIPQEVFDGVIRMVSDGDKSEVLDKLASSFIPRLIDAEGLVNSIAPNSIYMMLTQRIIADDGRVTAAIGPVSDDLDGHIVQQLGHIIHFYAQFYRPAFENAVVRLQLSAADIIEWLSHGLLFTEDRLELLKPAMAAYLENEWSTAIHLIVPQIENALRQLLHIAGQPVTRPHRNGAFVLKNLDEILREPVIEHVLPTDVRTYLRTILCDLRSFNIRNSVCHGLWDSRNFNWYIADRVVHALLSIGLVRRMPDASSVEIVS